MQFTCADPNAVSEMPQVANGRSADVFGSPATNGLRLVGSLLVSQEVTPDARSATSSRTPSRPQSRATILRTLRPSFPLVGLASGRDTPQIIPYVALRHRLPRLPRPRTLVKRRRASKMDAVGDKGAVDAPRRAAADASYRLGRPTSRCVVSLLFVAKEATKCA